MWKFGIASIASLCVLTGGLAVSTVLADSTTPPTTAPAPAGTDKITGTVLDQNKQPVVGATVMLFQGHGKGHKAADPVAVPATPTDAQPADPSAGATKGKHRPKAMQTVTTLSDGTFSFTGLADGNYMVSAMMKGVGRGRQTVKLDSSNPSQDITIALAPKGSGGKKAAAQ